MTANLVELAENHRIGEVEFVSPNEIKVVLDQEAPRSVALNRDGPILFPRVNGYLLVEGDDNYIVGQIEWIVIERASSLKHQSGQETRIVNLPFPFRRLRLNPLGTLNSFDGGDTLVFEQGVNALPSVGSRVILPDRSQLQSIVESGENLRVKIGSNPLAGDAPVSIDPNRLFGRHLAVIGNTGSGKSCTVAGLIRWSLEQANRSKEDLNLNARFIVLDPNGEYSRAFSNDQKIRARIFKVDPSNDEKALRVPLWFWNSTEWCSFTQASARTQRPLLRRALREIKSGRPMGLSPSEEEKSHALRLYLSSRLIIVSRDLNSGAILSDETKFGFRLKAIYMDLESKVVEHPNNRLGEVQTLIKTALIARYNQFEKDGKLIEYYRGFTETEVRNIVKALSDALDTLGGIVFEEGPDEDVPVYFRGTDFADHLEFLAQQENVTQYLDFLVSRIRTILANPRMKAIIDSSHDLTLESWLNDYIGSNVASSECLSIIDLSLVPTEVIHIVTAVIARITFEALQRYLKINSKTLPTVLIMEEAHTFIKRYKEDVENHDAAAVCCQVFERIAREGRKFGLGLVLSSQRPSELSPSVLSQCNSHLLHRISNDVDQHLVHRMVPDNLKGLLRELPVLPSQHAILLGWATELPVLLKVNDLPTNHKPRSDDPDYWGVWRNNDHTNGRVASNERWSKVAKDWGSIFISDRIESVESGD